MAVSSRGRAVVQIPNKWKDDGETSTERSRIWSEPPNNKVERRIVPVIYYLCRDGHLEHPHFIEVTLSFPEGLYLRDVIDRLNFLRGKGVATMYSWSCKRSYKNGFVWHDLAENDFVYPAHGQEHILKGSELLQPPPNPNKPLETASSASTPEKPPETHRSAEFPDFPAPVRRRNQSWSSSDFNEYKVYKKSTDRTGGDLAGKAADASTQTDDKRRRRRSAIRENESRPEEQREEIKRGGEESSGACKYPNQNTELSQEEISPPPSDSSPETLESLMKADGKVVRRSTESHAGDLDPTARNLPSGRIRPSTVLMQLISCGSTSFRSCGVASLKELSTSQGVCGSDRTAGLPSGKDPAEEEGVLGPMMALTGGAKLEEKEYFSGSLIETKKDETFSALKRSSSYDADRVSRLELEEREVRAKCIPRKPKTPLVTKKEKRNGDVSCSCSSSAQQGSSSRISLPDAQK